MPPRLRMATLYAVAQSIEGGGRVINTCNRSEDYVGYSTKFGDMAGDFSPLSRLTVTEVKAILTSKSVEQQTYRSCMGLLKLAEKYSDALLEAACKKALSYTSSPSYKSIKNILVTGSVKLESETTESKTTHKAHGITRGADYYRR